MSEPLYKYLNRDGTCRYTNNPIRWSLPHDGQPGEWMPPIHGPLHLHTNAYHAIEALHLPLWAGDALFELEYRGDRLDLSTQVLLREARLLRPLTKQEGERAHMRRVNG